MFNIGDLVTDTAHTIVGVISEIRGKHVTINVLYNQVPYCQGVNVLQLHEDNIELLPQGTKVIKHFKGGVNKELLFNWYDSNKGTINDITGANFTVWNLDGTCDLEFIFNEDDVSTKNDAVNHPSHYTYGKIEVIDYIEDKKLGYHLGNVCKYISRAGHKNNALEDLKKARWYLNRKIEKMEELDIE